MQRWIKTVANLAAAASVGVAAPASAASSQSVYPWVLMSAFASPASSKELCKRSNGAADTPAGTDAQQAGRDCVVPLLEGASAAGAGYPGATTAAVNALPLLAGLAALAGVTAFLLAKGGGKDQIEFPLSRA